MLALPVRAPTKDVEVTEVKPAIVVTVAPKDTDVLPMVMFELLKLALPMLLKVLFEPEIVLLVRVSVVARPTKVSELVGKVNVPVLVI